MVNKLRVSLTAMCRAQDQIYFVNNSWENGMMVTVFIRMMLLLDDQTSMFLSWSGPFAVVGAQQRGSANIFCQLRRHFSLMFGCG